MKVIVCGAGVVGLGITRQLSEEGIEVSVIDTNLSRVEQAADIAGVTAIVGNASHPDSLEKANTSDADIIIAVTNSDEANIVTCEVANALFKVPTKIARIQSHSYLEARWANLFEQNHLSIDTLITPERKIAHNAVDHILYAGAQELSRLAGGTLMVSSIYCNDTCPLIHEPLRNITQLFPGLTTVIVAAERNGQITTLNGDSVLEPGDTAYLVSTRELLPRVLEAFGFPQQPPKRIVFIGGSESAQLAARTLMKRPDPPKITIIESNYERCRYISHNIDNIFILHGEGHNREILAEAQVAHADVVVCLTDDDKINLLASATAKQMGAKRAVGLLSDPNLQPLSTSLHLDAFIDPRALTISQILHHLRRGRVREAISIANHRAELLEAEALETSPAINKELRDLKLPDGIRIGAIIRGGEIITPTAETRIKHGDRTVIFLRREQVHDVEKLFRVSLSFF